MHPFIHFGMSYLNFLSENTNNTLFTFVMLFIKRHIPVVSNIFTQTII